MWDLYAFFRDLGAAREPVWTRTGFLGLVLFGRLLHSLGRSFRRAWPIGKPVPSGRPAAWAVDPPGHGKVPTKWTPSAWHHPSGSGPGGLHLCFMAVAVMATQGKK